MAASRFSAVVGWSAFCLSWAVLSGLAVVSPLSAALALSSSGAGGWPVTLMGALVGRLSLVNTLAGGFLAFCLRVWRATSASDCAAAAPASRITATAHRW